MKTEISWKRRFLRKKLKYTLLCVVVIGVIFVVHQLFYFKQLNQVIVEKLITGTEQNSQQVITAKVRSKWSDPRHSKLIPDKHGRTVSLRGTHDQDIAKYLPNERGKFVCFNSKTEIDYAKVNDDYCDCLSDGSDEPGTNACNNGVFHCEISGSEFIVKIPSYKVNDGFCDCCDGSDEWAEVPFSYVLDESKNIIYKKTKCEKKC